MSNSNRSGSNFVLKRRIARSLAAAISSVALFSSGVSVVPGAGAKYLGTSVASAQSLPTIANNPNARAEDDYWMAAFRVGNPGQLSGVRVTIANDNGVFPDTANYEVVYVYGGETKQTATGRGYVDANGNHVLDVVFDPISVVNGATVQIRYYGTNPAPDSFPQGEGGGSRVEGVSMELNPVVSKLDVNAEPDGGRDLLKAEEDKTKCVIDVTRQNVGVSTWIAESYYDAGDGSNPQGKPRNDRRNYTVLQYRVDGVQGTEAFEPIGYTDWVYNALAYNPADGYLYAISQNRPLNGNSAYDRAKQQDGSRPQGHLLRISPNTGDVADLGRIAPIGPNYDGDVSGGMTNGTFDLDGNLIFANNSASGSGDVYKIKFNGGSATKLSEPAHDDPSQTITASYEPHGVLRSANDWAYYGFENKSYIWSLNSEDGRRYLNRTNVNDSNDVKRIDVTGISTPTGQRLPDAVYGNAWTYANGNLGFSANNVNGSGYAFQLALDDAFGSNPRVGLVSVETVPVSINNDATSNAFTVAEYEKAGVDLGVEKTLEMVDGQPKWTIKVTNNSDCASSGFTVRDLISGDLTNVTVSSDDDGWSRSTAEGGNLNWVHGPLGPKQSTSLVVEADVAEGKCAINKVSVIGNEPDPNGENNADAAGDCDPALSIKKYINGHDAQDTDTTDWPEIFPGKTVKITYVVKNTGTGKVTDIKLTDLVGKGEKASDIQGLIDAQLQNVAPFDLEGGAEEPISIQIELPEDIGSDSYEHRNSVTAEGNFDPNNQDFPTFNGGDGEVGYDPFPQTVPARKVKSDPDEANAYFRSTPPVVENPQFAVEKLSNQSAINLERNEDGKYAYSAEYTIIVRNDGKGDGEHAAIYDVPLRGVGFELNSVKVDGQDAQLQNGRYKIADGAALAAGESKQYTVTVAGTISDAAANNLPAAYGQCKADGTDLTKDSGLVNVVNMDGDSDGPDNNIVCTPVELRRLNIEKRIDGRGEAVVKPGEMMDIWYRVRNTGNVTLHDVKLSDNVQENNEALQQEITKQLNGQDTFDLEPGEIRDVHISVKAPEGEHVNEARADVPPTTIPPVTLPHTTVPGKPVPSTAVSTTAKAKSPKITIKKYVNGHDDGTAVAPGEDMEILYRVVNEGSMPVGGIRVVDKVTQATDKQGLQAAINAELAKEPAFKLEPGGVKEIRITVPAPAGGHVNEAVATAPVTVPGTTVPPITVPPITKPSTTIPGSTVPGTTVPSTVVTVTAPPDEGRSESPQLEIKKFINGRDEGDVLAVDAETMEITYRVTNTGASAVKGITIADEVTEGSEIPNLEQKLGEIEPFDLAPGEFKDITLTGVTAPKGGHVNVAKPVVPPVTVPATTIPGTTNPNTTIPPTTVPERTVSPTTTPSDDARSNVVKLELLKDIWSNDTNNWKTADKVDEAADAAVVDANGKMRIRYTVKNTGSLPVSGIGIVDEVTELTKGTDEDKQALTDAINAELEKYGKDFTLQPGKSRAVEITVDAPKQRHINVAKVTAPPVTTLPGSTIPGTTVMTTTNGSTVPVTTVTPRVVKPSTVTPNVPSNTAHATPTSSTTTPVVPEPVKPQFAVEKLGNQSGITLERNKDGKYGYSAEYTIRVRNTGQVAGEHAKVWDVPVRGVGFDIANVTVDGTEAKPNSGRYLISDKAELAVGEYKDYQVVVNGTLAEKAADALPAAVGQCEAVTPGNPGAGSGLVNTVEMAGDSDGPDNNIVCEPVELRRLNIEKRIDGRENAPVTPGEKMEIWYRVRNTGNVTLSGITLADQIKEDNKELQAEIDAAIAKIEAFDLAPGEVKDVTFEVTAHEGEHTNEVEAQVPETTVPGTTRPETTIPETTVPPVTIPGTTNPETTVPGTTIPGSTVPATTIPGTTVPGRSVPPTTVTATAHANSPKLEIKKFINGYDEGTQVAPGEDMEILYRVSNTGSVRIDGIRLDDEVTEAADEQVSKALQRDINAALKNEAPFALEPGEVREVRITVPAPAGGHVNVAKPIVPPVTVPGTTIPGTTNPNTTIPASTVPSTVVTVTTPSDDARSDSPLLDIKKYINNLDDGDIVEPGQDMVITYRVFNNGNADAKGVTIADEVTEGSKATKADLTKQIEAELAKVEPIDIPAGEFRDVEITVKAPAGGHVNVAKPNVPPVTVPATTIPGTTNPRTTIPETTVPELSLIHI